MPDLNSLPPSPYRNQSTTTPRRPSQTRRLSERTAPSSSTPPRSPKPQEDDRDTDPGPGPLRHPRPLTAAELHSRQEFENEAIVNRLTRELTLLRQQTASATSNASSTSVSTGIADGTTQTENVYLNNSIHPISARRHRSSSNLSSRGLSFSSNAATAGSTSTVNTTAGLAGSAIAPPRDASYSHSRSGGDPLSRQSSVASRRSEASSPSLSSSLLQAGNEQHTFSPSSSHHRHSHSNSLSAPSSARAPPNYVPTTHRYDEATHAKAELEMVKNENEALKGRIRELEQLVRRGGGSIGPSSATGSVSAGEQDTGVEERATAATGTRANAAAEVGSNTT